MNKRVYHRWTDKEARLLYQAVLDSNRNWRAVEKMFPQFSLLQLQNKFTIIEKQYVTNASRRVQKLQEASPPQPDDTLQALIRILESSNLVNNE
ncbi:Myb-like_DNA-binding domain-containing protein [Hexamita inflata]|uniref:Myb-like DNA-binding domain-containing protein n=1 Tax=Hexamita inflata TaxID=28002 RepID=A0AA86PXH3_9EUKA|nr:Myb-like DNA-binding domain-containing protein [Hexamita inflata]CAI9948091.1 Myb-like DNA-binding domain-containing protein [Hexamita inflata]CAI9948097.1 Myb-like DNA-binding domain-containing protein [Hexamita inflata]CAI9948108.1 Myb-like DNA-binding domain-containing protein [Hexamita inflata]CAI9948119.1 Myb-like DNA-binding domain-containing protein [Hexamita inflata]